MNDALRDDTRALADVVEDLLATAAGRSDERSEAALDRALAGAADDMAVLARDRNVHLVVTPGEALLRVTPTQLWRCLVALSDNAVGHSTTGGAVWVENEVVGDRVVIRVRDEGAGITGGARGVSSSRGPTVPTKCHAGPRGQMAPKREGDALRVRLASSGSGTSRWMFATTNSDSGKIRLRTDGTVRCAKGNPVRVEPGQPFQTEVAPAWPMMMTSIMEMIPTAISSTGPMMLIARAAAALLVMRAVP